MLMPAESYSRSQFYEDVIHGGLNSVLPDNWSAGWLATHRLSLRRRLESFRVALEEQKPYVRSA